MHRAIGIRIMILTGHVEWYRLYLRMHREYKQACLNCTYAQHFMQKLVAYLLTIHTYLLHVKGLEKGVKGCEI